MGRAGFGPIPVVDDVPDPATPPGRLPAPEAGAEEDGLPGTTPALEPSTEPEHPLRAVDCPALLPKEIG